MNKFNDVWTRKAQALGFPSRAVFKLLEANKKYRLVRPGSHVLDLGCAPGSWSKLSSRLAGPQGFVLGMDLTQLTHNDQIDMGVDPADINQPVTSKKSLSTRGRGRDTDELLTDGLLKSERKLIRSKSPVKFIQGDVTEWSPPETFRHSFDVLLSDMAPKTSGVPSHDSTLSIDLCHSVLDLCSQVFKAPNTKSEFLSDEAIAQVKHDYIREEQVKRGMHVDSSDQIRHDINNIMRNKYDTDEHEAVDPLALKKAVRRNAVRKDQVNIPEDGAIPPFILDQYVSPVRLEGSVAVQVKKGQEFRTHYPGAILMKVFQGEGFPALLRRMKSVFNVVHTFKPVSSRSESVEVFLYGKGYHGPMLFQKYKSYDVRVAPSESKSTVTLEEVLDAKEFSPRLDKKVGKRISRRVHQEEPVARPRKERTEPKVSLDDMYAAAGLDAELFYTADGMDEIKAQQDHFAQVLQNSNIQTNVDAAIHNASLATDIDLPSKVFNSKDGKVASIMKANMFLGKKKTESDKATWKGLEMGDESKNKHITAASPSKLSMYGTVALDHTPTPEQISEAMSMYWDEGVNFAKHVKEEYGYEENLDDFEKFYSDNEQSDRD